MLKQHKQGLLSLHSYAWAARACARLGVVRGVPQQSAGSSCGKREGVHKHWIVARTPFPKKDLHARGASYEAFMTPMGRYEGRMGAPRADLRHQRARMVSGCTQRHVVTW